MLRRRVGVSDARPTVWLLVIDCRVKPGNDRKERPPYVRGHGSRAHSSITNITASDAMARYSPELIAAIRHDYENTDKSLARIAADHGVSERSVNRMRDREGWARRSERVRHLPPAMQALREATELLAEGASPPATRTVVGRGGERSEPGWGVALANLPPTPDPSPPLATLAGGGATENPALAKTALPETGDAPPRAPIERIERLVERELAAEEAVRNRLGPLPRQPADAERCARTLATLTQTLHALARLRSGLAPDSELSNDDMPRDIDEFRRELARRIRAFVQSRTGGGLCAGVPAGDDPAGEP
jgi:transposase-like protein